MKKKFLNYRHLIKGLKQLTFWELLSLFLIAIVALPIFYNLTAFAKDSSMVWQHLIQTQLFDLIINSIKLCAIVVSLSCLLGVSLAWIIAKYDFKGRKFFDWAHLLPMSIPAYVLAFVYLGIFEYSGAIPSFLRQNYPLVYSYLPLGQSSFYLFIVMSFSLYPYVYYACKSSFESQGQNVIEAAQSLGYGPWRRFFKLHIPMARPWLISSCLLVFMECLADFGTVSIFNYDTFTLAIYKSWFSLFSIESAQQLSSFLIFIVFIIILSEHHIRKKMQFTYNYPRPKRIKLNNLQSLLCIIYCCIVFGFAFAIPIIKLVLWSMTAIQTDLDINYTKYIFNSLSLSFVGSLIIIIVALLLAYAARYSKNPLTPYFIRISTLGYAIPGTVLAVGSYVPFSKFEQYISAITEKYISLNIGLFISNTFLIVVFCYLCRFLVVGFGPIDNALRSIHIHLDEAAKSFGYNPQNIFKKVHLPLLKSGLITALLLCFVDLMKEMPITLMTRPFGWDSLAVKIYEFTSEGEWTRASLPALILVLTGLIPVIIISKQNRKENDSKY